jgi:4-alpha-glucanotransferase
VLRIDHVMGFHRLYWIPKGASADQGAYVRYSPDEFYAILCLESARVGALIVGEDLGTVPGVVRRTMRAHAIHRTYVVQEELHPEEEQPVGALPEDALATMNTHDMPPFAMFWSGADIERRVELGLFDEKQAAAEHARREQVCAVLAGFLREHGLLEPSDQPDRETVLRATLRALAASRARLVMPSLEDLWGAAEPQNTPGTGPEMWNWQRKGRYTLEQFRELPEVVEMLNEIARIRQEL